MQRKLSILLLLAVLAVLVHFSVTAGHKDDRVPHPLTDPFRKSLPTNAWTKRMKAGDDMFSPQALAASKARLLLFLDQVDEAGGDEAKLRGAFKSVVEDFDRLNTEHRAFIETMEREELASFLNHVADAARLPYKNNDVSWEWRKNW
jgi:hypothetical protein